MSTPEILTPSPRHRWLSWFRAQLGFRRTLVLVVLFAPGLLALGVDCFHRGTHLLELSGVHKLLYLLALLESCCVWGLLLYAAARKSWVGGLSSVLFVLGFTFALGGQVYFFEQYQAYLTQDLTLFAANLTESVVNQLAVDLGRYVAAKAPFLAAAISLVVASRYLVTRRSHRGRRVALAAPFVFVACWFVPLKFRAPQAATPDTLYLNAVGAYVRSQLGVTEQSKQIRPHLRHSLPIEPIDDEPPLARNVVFVLTESVRADAVCSAFDVTCKLTPHTNALLPERHALLQHRALDSTTAISLPVLWAGIGPHETEDVMHTWPLLFDYARAAGWTTAYWTSQNLFFASSHSFVENLGVDHFVSATQLDLNADIDMGAEESLLADYVIEHLSELQEPFFAMVHASNVHYPYFVDEDAEQPFQPAHFDKSADGTPEFRNYYQNAVVQQDAQLARILRALKQSEAGRRTVIIYTSDHGEAFRDHHQMGHTFSVFDEEIKVPAFIDAPPNTLTSTERQNLEQHEAEFTFHPDLTATALDLMGIWDAEALSEFKPKILGVSLLRDPVFGRRLPMTNCASLWSCAFENWGMMQGRTKVFARTPYDTGWHCYDVLDDPLEETRIESPLCDELVGDSLSLFGRAPY